jgi:putative oxidoreductase
MLHELLKKLESTRGRFGVTILRLILGAIFFKAGSGKLFGWFGGLGIEGATQFFQSLGIPAPHAQAIFVGCTEFLGGLALITGFLTRLAAIPLAITMIVAILTAHRDGDFYYPLVILCGLIALIDVGAGCLSLGRWINQREE